MIELGNLHGVEVAIEKLADHGRATSYRALYKAGHAVACKAWEMNQALHGPLHALPTVRGAGPDAVAVGHPRIRPQTRAVVRKHLELAKRAMWPQALQGDGTC